MEALYEQKITQLDVERFEKQRRHYIAAYYKLVDKYGTTSKEYRDKGLLASGIKGHYLGHISHSIQAHNGQRPSRRNDERPEKVVQMVGKTLRPYKHFRGKKRVECIMQKCNLKSLSHVMCNPYPVSGPPINQPITGPDSDGDDVMDIESVNQLLFDD